MLGAGVVLGEHDVLTVNNAAYYNAARNACGGLDAVRKACAHFGLYHKAVNNYFNSMLLVFLQLYLFRQVIYYAVDAHTHIARFACGFKLLCVLALSSTDNGGKYLYLCALRERGYLVNYLVNGLLLYLSAADGAVGNAYPCEKQTEVVVYLGNGSHSGAWVL